jgi:hypothetical protein
LKCKYCGFECDNPAIFHIHENSCLKHQEINGLPKEKQVENKKENSKK